LDDTSPAAAGQAPADVLEVPGTPLAERLTAHLLREIVARGARGGPLFPLASQLNDDVTHLQGQRLEGMLGDVLSRLARLDVARSVAAPTALAQLPPLAAGFTGRDDELAVLADLLNPARLAGPVSAVAGPLDGPGSTERDQQARHGECMLPPGYVRRNAAGDRPKSRRWGATITETNFNML
jgi:hypothetical protein